METITNKDLVYRFTEVKYAKKDEVRKDLNTSLIDPIWEAIKNYRARYNRIVDVFDAFNAQFYVCQNPTFNDNVNKLTMRIDHLFYESSDLESSEIAKLNLNLDKQVISSIGKVYNEEFSDEVINSILVNSISNIQGISEAKKKACDYFNTLKQLNSLKGTIDSDFLINLYINLSHNENLVTLYRNFDFKNNENYLNNELNGVSFNVIEKMMNNLYKFISECRLPSIIIASVAFFYINYVKPFDSFNEEISIILFKKILLNEGKADVLYRLPFESIFLSKEVLNSLYKEIIREKDLTYIIIKMNEFTNSIIDEYIKSKGAIKAESLEAEHLNDSTDEHVNKIKEDVVENKSEDAININKEISIPNVETNLSEEEAKKFQKYLLETNPYLKVDQAHFYVHHCTLGSYYTIQMYKNFEKVVYETARTSMDALAKFGYYKKEKIKNKFVYTPIKIEVK